MIFLILVVVAALTYLLTSLTPEEMQARREKQTQEALAQAREALVGYALQYRDSQVATGQLDQVYGFLPLPDLGTSRNNNTGCVLEGCDAANFSGNALNVSVVGRFPWRALGSEPLRDGHGECLWLVISGSHQRIQRGSPINWDTLSQLDVVIANGGSALAAALASAHDRPVAVVFSPGPPLAGQNRANSTTDTVTTCNGNYDAINYLDPATAGALGATSNYFGGATNNASGDTATTPKALATAGTIERKSDATLWPKACPQGSACTTVANDRGLALSGDTLFAALRKSSNFRLDVNSLLDRMATCLRDEFAKPGGGLVLDANSTGLPAPPPDKTAGRIPAYDACYGDGLDPRGYFSNYKDQVFVAKPNTGSFTVTVDGAAQSCAGALVFAAQRDTASQSRSTAAERNTPSQYLEGNNLTNFTGTGTAFAGAGQFARVSAAQTASLDIVRCIPAGPSFTEAPSPLAAADDLIRYNPATRTLTLGRQNVESDLGFAAADLFGCTWTPEARATGSGFRSYFKLNIRDRGDGFVFAAVDGDRNGTNVCGAGEQHLGYSGNNAFTTPIAYPKIGLEFDTRKNYEDNPNPAFVPDGFYPGRYLDSPWTLRALANGRSDPDYSGYHFALAYWGGESPISTGYACWSGWFCPSPSFCDTDTICKLNQEEDDNVHGQLPSAPTVRPPPQNPPRIDDPATPGLDDAYYFSPNPPPYPPPALAPLNVSTYVDTHIRVEVERSAYAGRDDNSRLVRVVATANLASLAGLANIDSIALQAGDTVLVAGQIDARSNGVYLASAGTWPRAANANESADLPPGTSWFIKEGATQRGTLWRLRNVDTPVINQSALVIQRFREAVRAVATTDIARAGLPTVGGVTLATGDRVLLKGQADAKQNGVYTASTGAWSRAIPENTAAGMKDGAMWFSTSGAGSYWRLSGDATPDTSNIVIDAVSFPSNNIYSATLTTKVWKLADSVTTANQIARMKITTRSMNQLDPVVRHGVCLAGGTCPSSNPDGQSCGGVEADGLRYCYTGQKPNLYDSKKIFDIRSTTSCGSNVSCSGNQFCGIDNVCYQSAFRTTRLGFTNSQSSSDQEIDITDFFTTWLP